MHCCKSKTHGCYCCLQQCDQRMTSHYNDYVMSEHKALEFGNIFSVKIRKKYFLSMSTQSLQNYTLSIGLSPSADLIVKKEFCDVAEL